MAKSAYLIKGLEFMGKKTVSIDGANIYVMYWTFENFGGMIGKASQEGYSNFYFSPKQQNLDCLRNYEGSKAKITNQESVAKT